MYPVPEPYIVPVTGAGVDTDGENHKAQNRNHLDGGEPELNLTIKTDGQEIQQQDDNPENCNENRDVDVFVPKLDNQARCRQFHCECRSPGPPVNPAHTKPKA